MRGAYTTDRAAALAGVPLSTLHYWRSTDLLRPSVSPDRVVLWSFEDLVQVRIVHWLRRQKGQIPGTPMGQIRTALERLAADGLELSEQVVRVDGAGRIYTVDRRGALLDPRGQMPIDEMLDPIAPFVGDPGIFGPNLREPRPTVRIHPGMLSGSPHVIGTRLETRALHALFSDGFSPERILALYPTRLVKEQLTDALDLEEQLARNLQYAA